MAIAATSTLLHPVGIQAAVIYPYQSRVQCVHHLRKHDWYVAAHFPPRAYLRLLFAILFQK